VDWALLCFGFLWQTALTLVSAKNAIFLTVISDFTLCFSLCCVALLCAFFFDYCAALVSVNGWVSQWLMAAAPVFLNWRLRNVQYDTTVWYESVSKWVTERKTEWMNDSMNKWMNEKVNKQVSRWLDSTPSANVVAMATRIGPTTFCMVPWIGIPENPLVGANISYEPSYRWFCATANFGE